MHPRRHSPFTERRAKIDRPTSTLQACDENTRFIGMLHNDDEVGCVDRMRHGNRVVWGDLSSRIRHKYRNRSNPLATFTELSTQAKRVLRNLARWNSVKLEENALALQLREEVTLPQSGTKA